MRRVGVLAVLACALLAADVSAQDNSSDAAVPAPSDAGAPDAAADGGEPIPPAAPLPEPEVVNAAPQAPPEGVGEIVVTAQRCRTNLQQTPISITAVSGEALHERGGTDLSGVAEATPNLQLTTSGNGSGGSSFAQVFIRGVGQPDFIITKDPAVGIDVDGVYLARAPGAFTPRMVGTLSAAYRILMGTAGSLTPRVDVHYSSGYSIDIDDTPGVRQRPYTLLDARMSDAPDRGDGELYVAATNLTQRAVIGNGVAAPANGSQIVSYQPPRMVYAGARFAFE